MFSRSILPRARTTAKLLPLIQARTLAQDGSRVVFSAPDRPAAPSTRIPSAHIPSAVPVPPNNPTISVAGSSTVHNILTNRRTAKKTGPERLDEEVARKLDEHEGGVFGVQWKRGPEELVMELKWLEEEVRATEKQMDVLRR